MWEFAVYPTWQSVTENFQMVTKRLFLCDKKYCLMLLYMFIVQSSILFLNMHVQFGSLVSPKKLSHDIERAQNKHCLKLLYPSLSYNQALNKSGLERIDSQRDVITQKMF